jgi:hypothetical protein
MGLYTGEAFTRAKLTTTAARENPQSKTLVEDTWSELQARSILFGGRWVFRLDDVALTPRRRTHEAIWYRFLAALGLRYNIDGKGRELFEHCVAEIVRGLTGRLGVRIGSPRRLPVPRSLKDAVDAYCQSSGEDMGKFHDPLATDGDLGLDVVSWMGFTDTRGGYLHFIGQCATGADWKEKLTELNPEKWSDHVSWAVRPVRFFATPVIVTGTWEFRRASKDGGLILDRPRLVALHEKAPLARRTRREIEKYCDNLYRN